MPCQVLIAATSKNHFKRGYPITIKNPPYVWGRKERPPLYVYLTITDATKAQVEKYLARWNTKFDYEILNETSQLYRIKITVDKKLISKSGLNKDIKFGLKQYMILNWGVSLVSHNNFQVIFDIAKPVNLQKVKEEINDKFDEMVDSRVYYFTNADVDLALANGGIIELTKQQVLSRIKSKLDE